MGIEPLHTGIERELAAIFSSPFCYEPIEELSAKASRPITLTCHEIVDVEGAAGEQKFVNSIPRHRPDFAIAFQVCQTKTFAYLALHLPDEGLPIRVVRP